MSQLNDENTRRLVSAGADVDHLLSHFLGPATPSFDTFPKTTPDLVRLYLILTGLAECVNNEIQERTHVVTDTGT